MCVLVNVSPNRFPFSAVAHASSVGGLNVAAAANGATVRAPSVYSANYPAAALINGDRRGAPFGAGGTWIDATGGVFSDWVEVTFAGPKTIDEIAIFGIQNDYYNPVAPTPGLACNWCGMSDYTVQYWTGSAWLAVPGGVVRGNALVWRTLTFAPITTASIRLLVESSRDGWSQAAEIEAYEISGTNTPPVVSLTSPANGSTATALASFTLAATATDAQGPVVQVAFFANATLLGTDTTSPFSLSWTDVPAGSYALTAAATDGGGLTTTSAVVNVTVTAPTGGGKNVAAAANGGTVRPSSVYNANWPAAALINGDRRGAPYGAGGTWFDATGGAFPDWVEVTFAGPKTIDKIAIFGIQDNYYNPVTPTPALTCNWCGLSDYTVQYWTGSAWLAVPGGVVRGNKLVWRTLTFAPITTTSIRLLIEGSRDGWSQAAEIEAYESGASGPSGEWFVAPGGTGDGSSGSPFGRIQHALDVAQPGHFITVRPGTYNEPLSTVRGGVPGQPIVLRSAGGRGSVRVTSAGRVLSVSHPHVAVEGLVLDGQYGADDLVRLGSNGDFFRLTDSELRRSGNDLVDMAFTDGVTIERSLLHHALNPADGRSDAHGVAAAAVKDLVIRDTEIHTFSGDGVQVDPGRLAPGWDRVTIERCHIWLAPLPAAENGFPAGVVPGENGIDTKASSSFPRASMVLREIVAHGFRNGLITNMAAFNLKEHVDVSVERVTVSDSEIAFRLRGAVTGGAWVAIQNAVVYDVLSAFRYEDNIQNLRIWNSTVGGAVTRAFQAASSTSAGLEVRNLLVLGTLPTEAVHASNLAVTASAFTNAATHDYTLAPGSPAIDAAWPLPLVVVDRLGVSRPQGPAPDVGAYERR